MPRRRRRGWVLGGVAGLVLLAGLTPGNPELVINSLQNDRVHLVLPLAPDERFTLRYRHSVNQTLVWEEHSLDRAGKIYIEEERFELLGAGMGHWPGHGRLVARGPHQVIEQIHAPTGNFRLRVGSPGVDHTIIWRGASVNLTELAAGEVLQVTGRPVRRFENLWRRLVGSRKETHASGIADARGA